MHDVGNLDSIIVKLEVVMEKKLTQLNLLTSTPNVSSTNKRKFSSNICRGAKHDTYYYGGTHTEHVVVVNNGSYS